MNEKDIFESIKEVITKNTKGLPNNWDANEMKELVKLTKGKKPEVLSEKPSKNAYAYLTAEYFRSGKIKKYVPPEKNKKIVEVDDKDIVFIWDGSKAGDIFSGLSGVLASTMVKIEPTNNTIDKLFLYFFIKTKFGLFNSKTTGSTVPHVNKSLFFNLKVPLPPLEEQKKIAGVLSAVQDAIERTEAVIQATKELKKSMMKHLFTYGPVPLNEKENVPLKETEIGMIPEEWKFYKIKELADVKGGKRLPKGHSFSVTKTNFPYIRVSDFKNWKIDQKNIKYLNKIDAKLLKRYTISSDDVYISIAGTIGLVGTIPKELDNANLTENAAKLVIKDKETINRNYFVSFLASKFGQNQIKVRTSKTSQPKLALTRIKTIEVPVPKYTTQKQIVEILSSIDLKIQAEENKKKALEDLFNSLLHNLMTAKIRVNDLDLESVEI